VSTLCTHCGTKINNYTMRGEHYCNRCRARQQTSASSIDHMRLGDFLPTPSAPIHSGYTEYGDTTCSSCTAPIRWWTFRSGRNAPFEAQPLTGLPHRVRFLVDSSGTARLAPTPGPTDAYWLCHWEVCPQRVFTRPAETALARIWEKHRARLEE